LTAFSPAGRAYPAERSAADPWFQHFAIIVSDMAAAYAMLCAQAGWTPISTGGPQLLPPETGGIVAFKFRDPDGHPLELSWFPSAVAGAWAGVRAATPFLGIDHSALAVADNKRSTDFYVRQLGFGRTGFQVNVGPAQGRLDGLPGAEVEITTFSTPEPGPHIELLRYRGRASHKGEVAINDVASTRLILETRAGGPARILPDPDGHLLELRPPEEKRSPDLAPDSATPGDRTTGRRLNSPEQSS
jgi:catechol 2,3-dioxygenase-like lactoylglutathione lyase family enzyme